VEIEGGAEQGGAGGYGEDDQDLHGLMNFFTVSCSRPKASSRSGNRSITILREIAAKSKKGEPNQKRWRVGQGMVDPGGSY
jgi:hypothetical protein